MLIFYIGVEQLIQCYPTIVLVNHFISFEFYINADYSCDWFIPFVGDDVVAKSISKLH